MAKRKQDANSAAHFGEAVYRPSEQERAELIAALDDPGSLREWSDVRASLRARR